MSGHGEKRSRKAEAAVAALLREPTVEAAARRAGVSERTLRTWLGDPAFLAAYRAARRQLVEAAVAKLQGAAGEAVDALRRNLTAARPADQIKAAVAVLDFAHRGVELADLLAEVEELKRLVKGDGDGAGNAPAGPGGVAGAGAGPRSGGAGDAGGAAG
jgi:hypothetical protein